MIFFFVVKEREGENFDLKISLVDFGITFFKNEKEIKKVLKMAAWWYLYSKI